MFFARAAYASPTDENLRTEIGFRVDSWLREFRFLHPFGREFTQPTLHQIAQHRTLLIRSLSQWCFGDLNYVTLADEYVNSNVILLLFVTPW